MTDTDIRLIYEKLNKFEAELKKLEKEIEALKPKQRYVGTDYSGHSYYVLEQGDLADAGTTQQWRVAKEDEDIEE